MRRKREYYDIFISYRRSNGWDTAKHLRDILVEKGYSVFFDVDSLRNGDFNMAVAPDGTENQHRAVLFHDTNANSANSKIIFHGGESVLRNVSLRGKTEGFSISRADW